MDLILSTRNVHKTEEVSRMLTPYGLRVLALPERVSLPPEDGETFEQNALIKAVAAVDALGVPVIADDSGIEAEALGGRPGVHSARFAGDPATDQQNLAKLMAEVPVGTALRYVCALAFVVPAPPAPGPTSYYLGTQPRPTPLMTPGKPQVFFGECRGTRAAVPAGDGGFGYDPAFIPDEIPGERTMAQLTAQEKDSISHRGRAVRAFGEWFAERRLSGDPNLLPGT